MTHSPNNCNKKITLKIYKNYKNPMQSGNKNFWNAEIINENNYIYNEPIMGWLGSQNMQHQIKLNFNSKEDAIAYAKNNEYLFEIEEEDTIYPQKRKSYNDNFKKKN